MTIFVFAFLYWFFECLQYPMRNPTPLEQIGSTLYFSFVTFTTLGLGDIEPINFFGRTLICCEAVIGAFLIALFVVVFARKMMR
ncbi:MAG: two pore domain potassium channel family protein [Theionarchaea archaeon]|nr:two pore domain potassium channel family protein [Theionarchaea archaeon]